jgi:hypothetical protein
MTGYGIWFGLVRVQHGTVLVLVLVLILVLVLAEPSPGPVDSPRLVRRKGPKVDIGRNVQYARRERHEQQRPDQCPRLDLVPAIGSESGEASYAERAESNVSNVRVKVKAKVNIRADTKGVGMESPRLT